MLTHTTGGDLLQARRGSIALGSDTQHKAWGYSIVVLREPSRPKRHRGTRSVSRKGNASFWAP